MISTRASPDRGWYAELVRTCENLAQGKRLEALLLSTTNNDEQPDQFLYNLLLAMYGRCGSLPDAQRTFDSIPGPTVYSWNLLIGAYGRAGYLDQARRAFDAMDTDLRSIVTWNLMISIYSHNGRLQEARSLFQSMPQRDVISWTALLTALAHCGQIHKAEALFQSMPYKTPVSWNTMLFAYADTGHASECYSVFQSMPEKNIISWTTMVVAFARTQDLSRARALFDQMPQRTLAVWSTLVAAYAGTDGHECPARELFDAMPERDGGACSAIIGAYGRTGDLGEARRVLLDVPVGYSSLSACTAMLVAYARNGHIGEARDLFDRLLVTDVVVWNAMICGYAENGQVRLARDLFDKVPESTIATWNTMITAYGEAGDLHSAKKIFDGMPERNVISWNAMITAYALNGAGTQALWLFGVMDSEGVRPSSVTSISVLECVSNIKQGKLLQQECQNCVAGSSHDQVVLANSFINLYMKHGCMEDAKLVFDSMPEHSVSTWNSMVSGYARNGHLSFAQRMLELMPQRSLPSSNSLISGYAHAGHPVEALGLLEESEADGVTLAMLIGACSSLSDLSEGRKLEGAVFRSGVQNVVAVGNSLISMYGKCGCLRDARRVFETMAYRDVITWNAMLAAEAQNGESGETLELLQVMSIEGIEQNSATRAIMLFACSHVGKFVNSEVIATDGFGARSVGGVVDLLGRAGLLEAAEKVMCETFETDGGAWRALLAACRMHGDEKRGLDVGKTLMNLEPQHSSAYVLAANVQSR